MDGRPGCPRLGAALALPMLLPWVAFVDLTSYLAGGDAFWEPGWLLVVAGTAWPWRAPWCPPRAAWPRSPAGAG